jgi:hypothetical protein
MVLKKTSKFKEDNQGDLKEMITKLKEKIELVE